MCTIPFVIRRFYIHNFRCLENFELPIAGLPSVLLIGKNGSGKTSVSLALEILQRIASGTNQVGELVKPKDLAVGRAHLPMRLEIEVELDGMTYLYSIALEFQEGFKEPRVRDEKLTADGKPVYTRDFASVQLGAAKLNIDWHLVALPIIQQKSTSDPVSVLKRWLASMLIMRPVPSLILGFSDEETIQPNSQVTNLAAWFSGLVQLAPRPILFP